MTKTTRTLSTLIITAGLALAVAPAAGASTVAGSHPAGVMLPAPRGGGNGGGGGGGGHSSGGGAGGGGGHNGNQQYVDALAAAGNNDSEVPPRHRRVRPGVPTDPQFGCGDPYYSSNNGCYQPQG